MTSTLRFTLVCLLCAGLPVVAQDKASSRERIRLARDLAKRDNSAIPQLAPLLKDADPEVRYEAVQALVRIGSQYSLDPLTEATRDNDPEVQIHAVDGLVNFYLPGYVPPGGLMAPFRRMSASVRSRFETSNQQVIDPYVVVRPQIIQAIGLVARGGSSLDSRANAARATGVLRGRAAVPDLLQALRSKDDRVIFESLIALQKIGDPSAGPGVVFLVRDLVERVQITAIETIGLLQTRQAAPELRLAFDRAASVKVQRAAILALAQMPDEANRPLFLAQYTSTDERIRTAAFEGFGRLRNPRDQPTLKSGLDTEPKMLPRLAAAFGLVLGGDTLLAEASPLRYLVNTLNSKSFHDEAQAYLTEAARDTAVRLILGQQVGSGTRDEKIGIAAVLAVVGTRDETAALEKLSNDGDTAVADAGLRALRNLRARNP